MIILQGMEGEDQASFTKILERGRESFLYEINCKADYPLTDLTEFDGIRVDERNLM